MNLFNYRDFLKIGVNHHLLYSSRINSASKHYESLLELLSDKRLEVIDYWVPDEQPFKDNEIAAIRDSGKVPIYNIGTRKGKEPAHPATLDRKKYLYSLDFYKSEIERGLKAGSSKFIMNSGPDIPEKRDEAKQALFNFCIQIYDFVGDDAEIIIEPTDRDADKCKLIGPSKEAAELVKKLRDSGRMNFKSMIDMCHLPLMKETIEKAVMETKEVVGHVHLGNCIVNDRGNPLFGDKHPPWGIQHGVFSVDDVAVLIHLLRENSYFQQKDKGTVSFEMRPYPGYDERESLDFFFREFNKAWELSEHMS